MKKYTTLVALSLLLVGAGNKAQYSDIENHWAKNYIEKMSDSKLLLGYTDGSFKPNNYILNVETYTIINRIFKFDNYTTDKINSNLDSHKDKWYYNELLAAESGNYINFNRNFNVEPITRLEVCKILSTLYNLKSENKNYFTDLDKLQYKEIEAINSLAKDGIINGFGDNTFRPKEKITRAELSKILTLSIERYGTELRKFDPSKYESLLKKLENLSKVDASRLSSTDIQKLNYIIEQTSKESYISNSDFETWNTFLDNILSGFNSNNVNNPNANSSKNINLNIKVSDSMGNPISASIKINNKPFTGARLSPGKYLIKVESPGKKSYESFLEINLDQTLEITLEDAKQSFLKLTLNSTYLSSPAGYEFKSGARVSVKIDVPTGMEVDSLIVNGVKKGVLSDKFTFIIKEDTQIDVSFKPEENR
ncbi:S-layer homology domain-containing protein [Peptoniphilus indolicus]|uniref:Parasporal protein n=1 Tax=Peptoniphilus indolicus TaxID=33030 RepID=A0A379D9P7_9FIRM|nr:S-layer homology domain-containing protein [Peptoniphilus indolicus]SUB74684.1 Parasporal protein [Peptoniphilus indolicus]